MSFIYLAIPSYSGKLLHGHLDAILQASQDKVGPLDISGISALTFNFNLLFANALNARKRGITHFAMMHDDLVPELYWLDKLHALLEKHRADMISVVAAIKDTRGLTSTALDISLDGSDPYWRPTRLTLTEIFNDYPPTFSHPKLLLNTGLMLIDLRKPWVEEMYFEFDDRIIKNQDGDFVAQFAPEDWNFSRKARSLGAKLLATREVTCKHHGNTVFHNRTIWGDLKKDILHPQAS